MPIKAITFDLDDTLWAIEPVIARAEQRVHAWLSRHYPGIAARYDVEALRHLREQVARDYPDLAHDFSHMRKESLRRAAQDSGYPDDAAVEEAFTVFMNARNEVSLFDEVLPVLERINKRYTLGALSNGNANLERIGIAHHFEFHLSALNIGKPKPHRAMFDAACELANTLPSEMIHVGDHPQHDIEGAAAVGIRTVWINRQRETWSGALAPDAQITNLTELEVLLEQWR